MDEQIQTKVYNIQDQYEKLANKNLSKDEKNIFIKVNEKLDKYYTKQVVADYCYNQLIDLIKPNNPIFVEPSAGSGIFLNSIKGRKIGFDIAPASDEVIKADFLNDDLSIQINENKDNVIVIGNPPFGRKSKIAIQFVNKSFEYSNIVGFILPIQFRKWSSQSNINPEAKLIIDLDLQENAFEFMGKDYKVRCCFQIWKIGEAQDLRIKNKPSTKHSDFEMYQYNRTEEAKKFFDCEWDFAVPRQGYCDYTRKFFNKKNCDFKQQWIFFKAKDKEVLDKLMKLDFVKLSRKNIGMPGFGKADVVQEYLLNFL